MSKSTIQPQPDPNIFSLINTPSTFIQTEPQVLLTARASNKSDQPTSYPDSPDELIQHTDGLLRNMKTKWISKKITKKLKSFVPPAMIPIDANVQEEWMNKNSNNYQDHSHKTLENAESRYMFKMFSSMFALTELFAWLLHLLYFWFVSIDIIMQESDPAIFLVASQIWICANILYILIDLNTQKIHLNSLIKNRVAIIKRYFISDAPIDFAASLLTLLANYLTTGIYRQLTMVGLALLLVYKIRKRFQSVEECFEGRIGPGWFKLMQCFVFLAYFAHTCALVLYSASLIHPEENWLDRIPFTERNWFCDYVYSLYWAVTIIVTVGFGDIGPKNKYEIGIVLLIEILGTSFFGYMINVIGMTLTNLQKQREAFESTLKTADKLCHCFGLDSSLSYRLRTYLKNNQRVDTMFNLADENKIMEKLSPALKKQVLKETNSQIIEKCLFFLTYFKFSFLSELSLRLTKRIIQPGEELPLSFFHPKMYIIDTGSIDIEVERNHRSRVISKKVHSISRKSNKEVGNNLYGYVFVITGHSTRLHAVSTSFTFVYELAKHDFFDCIQPGSFNHQIICELKHRYLEHRLIDEIEAPQLTEPTKHYTPNTYLLLLKNRRNKKFYGNSKFQRSDRSAGSARELYRQLVRSVPIDISSSHLKEVSRYTMLLAASLKQKIPSLVLQPNFESEAIDIIQSPIDLEQNEQSWKLDFDTMKQYKSYMKNSNMRVVLGQYKQLTRVARGGTRISTLSPRVMQHTYSICTFS